MPFPKSAQRKGGQRPATETQKMAARRWMHQNKPWEKATGPQSLLGKTVSSGNAIRAAYVHLIKSWESNFAAECLEAESVIAEFEQAFRNRELQMLDYYSEQTEDGDRLVRRYVVHIK